MEREAFLLNNNSSLPEFFGFLCKKFNFLCLGWGFLKTWRGFLQINGGFPGLRFGFPGNGGCPGMEIERRRPSFNRRSPPTPILIHVINLF
jgi:hypothetical protein